MRILWFSTLSSWKWNFYSKLPSMWAKQRTCNHNICLWCCSNCCLAPSCYIDESSHCFWFWLAFKTNAGKLFFPDGSGVYAQLLYCSDLTKGINDTLLKPTTSKWFVLCECECRAAFVQHWGYLAVRLELSPSGLCLAENSKTQKARRESWMALPWHLLGLHLDIHHAQSNVSYFYTTSGIAVFHYIVNSTHVSLAAFMRESGPKYTGWIMNSQ